MTQVTIDQALQIAVSHHQSGRLAEAEGIYRQILAQQPTHADALQLLGTLAGQTGRFELATELLGQVVAQYPANVQVLCNLGEIYRRWGKLEEAIVILRRAIALKPDLADAHNNLGAALKERGQLDESISALRRALELAPDFAEACDNLGNALRDKGELEAAIAAYRKALALRPNSATTWNNLGTALKDGGQLDESIAALKRALELAPDLDEAHNNLGNAFKEQGRLDEALACYDRGMVLAPHDPMPCSNRIYAMLFHPAFDAADILKEGREWERRHAPRLQRQNWTHDRTPDRRLRIGYVSPDFRDHVVGRNILPLFQKHDHAQFEIFCYAQVSNPDALTGQFRTLADHWRNIVGVSDAEAVRQIREDRIDVLVDLALHLAGNRLTVLAHKPAPVQVTFAGYPGTTGLAAIDYRLTDPYLDPPPPEEVGDKDYVETSIRLPHSFWCFDREAMVLGEASPPEVGIVPALKNGYITFGCLNNFCKVNDTVLRLWARVLRAVQDSRLLLLTVEGSHRQHTLDVLLSEGIDSSRIEFAGRRSRGAYLALYQRIDIGLDTLPYNGHTTSLDSFWMGVPVVTLVGKTVVGRAGLSQLSNLGLTELAAYTPEDYVRIASVLAQDLNRLATMRSNLRHLMEQSPLMNASLFARDIEVALRQMWQHWCSAPTRSGT